MFADGCFEGAISEIVQRLKEQECKKREVVKKLEKLKVEPESLFRTVETVSPKEVAIGAVDGGMAQYSLHGLDLIMLRAVAVLFRYRGRRLEQVEYRPSELPSLQVIPITEPIDAHELGVLAGMRRQRAELEAAAEALEGGGVDVFLLDGSVVPQYVERYPRERIAFEEYEKLIRSYVRLYEACADAGVLLAGVVKDSRGRRFIEVLLKDVLPSCGGLDERDMEVLKRSRDTALLDHVLKQGERTFTFSYAENPASYVLSDLGKWGQRVHAFYFKTVPFDAPIRVEFLETEEGAPKTADRIASLLLSLSSSNEAFGLPPVLIEADLRARLRENDTYSVRDWILNQVGGFRPELRRDRRPF